VIFFAPPPDPFFGRRSEPVQSPTRLIYADLAEKMAAHGGGFPVVCLLRRSEPLITKTTDRRPSADWPSAISGAPTVAASNPSDN
jgi:hypothetical protein